MVPKGRVTLITAATVFGLICVGIASGLWWWNERTTEAMLDYAVAEGRELTERTAADLDRRLGEVPVGVQDLAAQLATGSLRPSDVPTRLRTFIEGKPAAGYGVAFEPFAAGTSRRLFAPYVEQNARGPASEIDLAALYPYNEYRYGWFSDTLLDGGGWTESRVFPDSEQVVAIYAMPFSLPGSDEPSGVAFATVTLENGDRALRQISLGESSYAFVVSRHGQYLVHPRRELVRRGTTLFETAWASGNTGLHSLAVNAAQGERLSIESPDEITGRVNWVFAEPLKTTGWSLFSVFFRDEFRPNSDWERREFFLIVIFGLAGIWLLSVAVIARVADSPAALLWLCSNALVASLVAGLAMFWYLADRYPVTRPATQNVVLDQGTAHDLLREVGVDDRMEMPDAIAMIPTGVYIRSIVFRSGSEVAVSGYVWQRYDVGRHDDVPRGFALPEAFDPEQSEITEIYRIRTAQDERIGWYFAASFRQAFDYTKFPFDRQSIWVRLQPAHLATNVAFVPDFDAYDLINPGLTPGISDSIVLSGWNLVGSHFDYRVHQFNANLGLATFDDRQRTPELYFNVEVKRQFLGPFISYMVPLAVTAVMLFALLLISSRKEASAGLLGFSAAEIVLGAAALFFVVSFQHIAMRDALDASALLYFEYFYFVLYALLMMVAINAILFASDTQLRLIEYADNLMPKVLFWPVALLTLFTITVVQFY